jgi:hypothetical protein
MTDDRPDLERIRESLEGTLRCRHQGNDWAHCIDTSILIEKDVPALLAEVERLRAQSDREAEQALRLMGEVNDLREIALAVATAQPTYVFQPPDKPWLRLPAGMDPQQLVTRARALLARARALLASEG